MLNRSSLSLKTAIFEAALLLAAAILFAHSACADNFRCGRKLVVTGDSSGELIRKCGQPRHKDRGQEKIRVDGVFRKVGVERWYYKKSPRSLEHAIVIYKGRVAAVEVGSR